MAKMFERIPYLPEDFDEAAEDVLEEVLSTLKKKNRDYGGASFDMGLVGNYVLVHNKENRLKSLIEGLYDGIPSNFESIEDTYRDLIGYSVIGILIHRAQFGGSDLSDSMGEAHFEVFREKRTTDMKYAHVFEVLQELIDELEHHIGSSDCGVCYEGGHAEDLVKRAQDILDREEKA